MSGQSLGSSKLTIEALKDRAKKNESVRSAEGNFLANDLLNMVRGYVQHCVENRSSGVYIESDPETLDSLPECIRELAEDARQKEEDDNSNVVAW